MTAGAKPANGPEACRGGGAPCRNAETCLNQNLGSLRCPFDNISMNDAEMDGVATAPKEITRVEIVLLLWIPQSFLLIELLAKS